MKNFFGLPIRSLEPTSLILLVFFFLSGCTNEGPVGPPGAPNDFSPGNVNSANVDTDLGLLSKKMEKFFFDDFNSGDADHWNPRGGTWKITDGQYIGEGTTDTSSDCDILKNQALIRDLEGCDVDIRLDMKSIQRVDKLLVLRSVNPGNQIELNFRAERPGAFAADLIVQERTNCHFILHTPEFSVLIPPHQVGQTIHTRTLLIGRRVLVWIDNVLVLNRLFPIAVRKARIGLGVIEQGVTAFDNVKVHVLRREPTPTGQQLSGSE